MAVIICLVGVSGSGKTSLAQTLVAMYDCQRIVTCTTRAPRTGEVHGRDYYFVTPSEFSQCEILAPTVYAGVQYGIPEESVRNALALGKSLVIVVDANGAQALRRAFMTQTVVVHCCVDEPVAEQRMRQRGDAPSRISERLSQMAAERQRNDALQPDLQLRMSEITLSEAAKIVAERFLGKG